MYSAKGLRAPLTRHSLLDVSAGAGLIVLDARRRHGYFGLQRGWVAHSLVHHAACPVVVTSRA
ncbi:universal stress protein [Streptomyces scopuliridis]